MHPHLGDEPQSLKIGPVGESAQYGQWIHPSQSQFQEFSEEIFLDRGFAQKRPNPMRRA